MLLAAMYTEEDRDACLNAFDQFYDLMLKINPRFAKKQFEKAFDFPNGDPLTGNLLFQPSEIQMEVLLAYARDSIITYGIDAFFKLVNMMCNQEPYSQIGVYLSGMSSLSANNMHGLHVTFLIILFCQCCWIPDNKMIALFCRYIPH